VVIILLKIISVLKEIVHYGDPCITPTNLLVDRIAMLTHWKRHEQMVSIHAFQLSMALLMARSWLTCPLLPTIAGTLQEV
jgi:hypothetical protein